MKRPRGAAMALAAGIVVCMLITPAVFAQTERETPARVVKVGVYVSPPFIVAGNNTYDGMAIDLWEVVAGNLNLATRYVAYPTIRALVDASRNGEIDAAVTNLTITRARAESVLFTQPWYDAGLRLMVRNGGSSGFDRVVSELADAGHCKLTAGFWPLSPLRRLG